MMRGALPELEGIPGPPRDSDMPVFNDPWEARAFAMVLALHERGLFTWPQWAEALSRQIALAQAAGDADLGDTYYRHWVPALESLVENLPPLKASPPP
jgi:nitrile hydratase accessory protein